MSNHFTRRSTLLSVAAVAAILLASPVLAQDVTITFWGSYGNGGNSTQQDALNDTLIPAFEAAHPGIKVKYVDVPYDSLLQKLTTSAAGGELPIWCAPIWAGCRNSPTLACWCRSRMRCPNSGLADKTYPGVLATNFYRANITACRSTQHRVLVTSQEALDAAGLSHRPPASTTSRPWPKSSGQRHCRIRRWRLGAWNIMPWIWSGGGTSLRADRGQRLLDSAQNVATIQMLVVSTMPGGSQSHHRQPGCDGHVGRPALGQYDDLRWSVDGGHLGRTISGLHPDLRTDRPARAARSVSWAAKISS